MDPLTLLILGLPQGTWASTYTWTSKVRKKPQAPSDGGWSSIFSTSTPLFPTNWHQRLGNGSGGFKCHDRYYTCKQNRNKVRKKKIQERKTWGGPCDNNKAFLVYCDVFFLFSTLRYSSPIWDSIPHGVLHEKQVQNIIFTK